MTRIRNSLVLTSLGWGALAASALGGSLLTGCLPDAPRPPATPPAEEAVTLDSALTARQMFSKNVLPLLTSTCATCHSLEVGVGPGFLRSAVAAPEYDPYPIIIGWNNFIVSEPELSALLTKGQHEGPAMSMSQYDAALAWLRQEKRERDAVTVTPFKQQVPPFSIAMTATADKLTNPTYNTIDLGKIDPVFVGAYIRFVATTLNETTKTGVEISDLRFFNRKPGAATGEQRSIHFKNPLFVLWKAGVAYPDPAQSFYGFERSIKLDQDDAGSQGVLMIPGILVLDQYRTGYSMNIVFDLIELVKPVIGGNPCSTGTGSQLEYFEQNLTRYFGAKTGTTATSCAQTTCHDPITKVGEIDMTPTLTAGSNLGPLCEQLKFYNGLGVILKNTDPSSTSSHPFKWTDNTTTTNRCQVLTPNENPCFDTFKSKLDAWLAIQ